MEQFHPLLAPLSAFFPMLLIALFLLGAPSVVIASAEHAFFLEFGFTSLDLLTFQRSADLLPPRILGTCGNWESEMPYSVCVWFGSPARWPAALVAYIPSEICAYIENNPIGVFQAFFCLPVHSMCLLFLSRGCLKVYLLALLIFARYFTCNSGSSLISGIHEEISRASSLPSYS